jgi:hypothetical protein
MERTTYRNLLFATVGLLSMTASRSQTYTQPTVGVQNTYTGACMVTTCSGTFYDNGGAAGNYAANVNSIFRTFCPNAPGMCMRATFTSFSMNDQDIFCFGGVGGFCCDYLQILNGPVQNSPAVYNDCIVSPGTVTASNPSGCLTFRFTSDASIQLPGWSATLSCVPCAGGPAANTNSDCAFATPVCADTPFSDASPGPGITAEGCAGCVTSENYTNWYRIQVQTSGTLAFTINPNNNADDFDPVVFGPNVSCAALGSPARCSYAINAGNGNTGLGNGAVDPSEDVAGDQWVSTMNVTAGQTYYVMINGWSATSGSNGFLLDWTGTAGLNCTILPVELTSLHAACENGEPTLRWTTASEHGNSGFFIQRSIDGEQWKDIGWVNGAGNSTQALNYVFADREPLPQRLAFYRLRQVDMDGVEELSEIVYVKDCDGSGADLRLVPNPVEDIVTLYVDLGRDTQGSAEVEFIDAFGRSLQRRSMGLSPEQSSIVLDISSLPSGSYTVALRHIGTGRVLRSRMIKR